MQKTHWRSIPRAEHFGANANALKGDLVHTTRLKTGKQMCRSATVSSLCRDRETERDRETDSEIDRETDRETDRARQRETDRDRQRQTKRDRERQRETDRDRQRQTETDRDRQRTSKRQCGGLTQLAC